ncbi:MAG: NAD+ synthase [Steroidobacteraceae bacterium]
MTERIRIALAQIDLCVGDALGNAGRIVDAADRARAAGAGLVVFPELALSGYPPEDLLFHRGFRRRIDAGLERIRSQVRGIDVLFGYPAYEDGHICNAAAWIRDGRVLAVHRKLLLPNYSVFDEKRYFRAGHSPTLVELSGRRVAILVCEDVWESGPAARSREAGAELLVVLNASPFEIDKQEQRERIVAARARETGLPIVYVNLVGGQDELVFDGQSFVVDAGGAVRSRAPAFVESGMLVEVDASGPRLMPAPGPLAAPLGEEERVYRAIQLGIRDYVGKHRFPGVVLGLSGGIDSALVLALAVDALGADRVEAVMMPSRFTSQMSLDDAAEMARGLGVKYSVIPIEGMFEATLAALAGEFAGCAPDATEENIQARCRGMLLMGISNKTGRMLLTTGNKSEMAVGYATLYGDMAGGFAPIKDLSKLLVYRLSRWRNSLGTVIPERIIERPPSAELRADQRDSDSLPPYEILDPILTAFIEEDLSVDEIVARGFDRDTVVRVLDMVRRNEYKRRQAPPGVRISGRAFGRDWRYPITSGYRASEPGA